MSLAAAVAAAEGPPPFLDVRFDADGKAVRCAGSTVVAHVAEGPWRDRISALRDALMATEAGDTFAWLPPSSYHMTLFDGLLHDRRAPGFWPDGLAADAGPAAADGYMVPRLGSVAPPGAGLEVVVTGASGLDDGGLGLAVTPVLEPQVRAYRDEVAAAVGLAGRPGHDSYAFHITLAYQISWPSVVAARAFDRALQAGLAEMKAAGPIVLGPVDVCLFDDMTHFAPQH